MKEKKLLLGAHTSAAGGVFNALYEGREIGASTIQFFTSNQKQWAGRAPTPEVIAKWEAAKKETEIQVTMSHDSYLINLGAPDPENLVKSRKAFREELERCQALQVNYLNFHPGAALKTPLEQCLDTIVVSLLELEPQVHQGKTELLIEATAGQGSAVGWRFEELAYLIERTHRKMPVGVCIDTCHIFAAGYDLRTPEACDQTFQEFDRIVGLKYLKALHLNDSAKGLGTRVDRHRALGKGEMGWDCFRLLVTDPRTAHLPMYLETPDGKEVWKEEIKTLRMMSGHRS